MTRNVLRRYLAPWAEEAGITTLDSLSALLRLLVRAMLMSARIRSQAALVAAEALFRPALDDRRAMAGVTWAERTGVLNRAGYARYDGRTSRLLEDTSEHLLERYRGDLRRLRAEAARIPDTGWGRVDLDGA